MPTLGVDGCRGGWAVASAAGVIAVPTFADVLDLADGGVVGVDMPIGLPDAGPRACDVAARRELGRPRGSSVFPAPPRAALGWRSWADAAGVSRQAYLLLAKIREVDELMSPALQSRVVEVHPELSFAAMAGGPMRHNKKTAEGRAERLAALALAAPPKAPGAAADDVLDALAVLWTAQRVERADERRLGDGAVDAKGLRMEIVV